MAVLVEVIHMIRPLFVYISFAVSTTPPNKGWAVYIDTQPNIRLTLVNAPVLCRPLDRGALCVHDYTDIWNRDPI